jgi:hypothetical protein
MATDVVFVPDIAGWEHAFKLRGGVLADYIDELTGDVADLCKFEAPGPGKIPHNRTGINYGKGVLMTTIGHRLDADGVGEIEGLVWAVPKYAKYVINGTRPHMIFPKKPGGRLRFFWWKKARMVAFRHVRHPGTAANDFLLRGLKRGLALNGIT